MLVSKEGVVCNGDEYVNNYAIMHNMVVEVRRGRGESPHFTVSEEAVNKGNYRD